VLKLSNSLTADPANGIFMALRAISSAGERCLHTAEVAGSNPASPTPKKYLFAGKIVELRIGRCSAFDPFDDSLTTVEIATGGPVLYGTHLRCYGRRSCKGAPPDTHRVRSRPILRSSGFPCTLERRSCAVSRRRARVVDASFTEKLLQLFVSVAGGSSFPSPRSRNFTM
jgi:hypothetical protein